jgi:hypothetical protein
VRNPNSAVNLPATAVGGGKGIGCFAAGTLEASRRSDFWECSARRNGCSNRVLIPLGFRCAKPMVPPSAVGGGKGIRTPDLLIANETLYQLSYTPIVLILRKLGGSVGRSAFSLQLHLSTKIKGIAMNTVKNQPFPFVLSSSVVPPAGAMDSVSA